MEIMISLAKECIFYMSFKKKDFTIPLKKL